ncbi:MAG TPA: PAS domain S-box protein, partial [Polyangiales bacterium]
MSHRPRGLEDDTPAAPGEVPQLKDLFGAILQQAIDGFWVVDRKGRFLEVNAAYCELVGYSREELLRRSITDIEAAEAQVQTAEHIARVRATGGDRFLTKHRRKDGTIVDVEISAQYMEQAGGFVFVFVRDVTGREREVELQQTARHGLQRKIDERDAEAALLRNTIEQLPLSVVLTDTDGRIEYVNPAFTRITGYAPVEVIGSTPRVLKSGAQRAPVYDQLWTAIKAGRQWQGELINRRKDGTTYAQELLIAPVHDRQSGTVRLVGIGQDVTERNQLRDSLELTQFSLDHSTDAVLWVDAQGRVTYASLGASRLLGYTREELLTRSIWELSSQLSAQSWPQRWAQTSHAGFWRGEDEARRKDGSSVATEIVVTHVRFGGKEIQCAILRDLTERNRASQALRESARTMAEAERIGHFGSYRLDVAAETWTSSAGLDEIFGVSGASISRDIPGWLSVVHPEQRQELADYIAHEVLGKGRAFDHEYRIVRIADGEVRWVHGLGTLLTDREGHPVEMFGTVQDITDDKREGALLQESVELNRRMLASSVFGTLIYDGLSGQCLVANDAAARVVGASVGQLSTQTFRRLASWKDSGLLAAAESVLQSGVSLRKTFVVCTSPGKDVVLDCFLAVFETERRPRLLLIFEDVTAYRGAEEALRKSEARHRALLRALPDLVVVLDRCGVVLDYHG